MAKYTNLSSLFTAIADAIRAKKGTTDTIVADNFPDEIAGIKVGATVFDLMSNLKTYKDSISINGKTLENVFGQQTYFANTGWFDFTTTTIYANEIVSDDNAENKTALLFTRQGRTSEGSYPVLTINTNIPTTSSDARTYLLAIRAKSSEFIASSFAPSIRFSMNETGVERDGIGSTYKYQDFRLWNGWAIWGMFFTGSINNYFSDCQISLASAGSENAKSVYLDWIMGFDITDMFDDVPSEGVMII